MKNSKVFAAALAVASFGTVTGLSQIASASTTTPHSMRGYYIGDNHLLWLTKHTLHEGAPQADVYSYHIRSISKSGKTYRFHTTFTLGDTIYPTLKLKKVGYHKIRLVGMATVHKVTKSHYYRYANGGY
ncbi:hypothetical protein LZY01_01910 [Levilactobacillus zymae]|uniref:Uncharacterized protein n=1 Tax=Levilactobacillus zymae TaxID=267363 RepID=A0ABQ0WTG3_9LACO|nr:hypothetical protein [Levilactobacillus zymae]QFR60802.1 hypothetical protein LZ395_04335 [Levilactobacillus zymae]GEO71023.1 hypothetical protein LZY01_01910 [Levilactobacillus zymae]